MNRTSKNQISEWRFILFPVIILIAVILRFINIQNLPFYLDEQLHTHQAIQMLEGGPIDYNRAFVPVTLPVYISFSLLGISWLKARLPMIILNALGIIPLWYSLKKFSKLASVIGAILFVINPWIIATARSVREYAILPIFFFLAALIMTNFIEKSDSENKKKNQLYLFGLVSFIAYLLIFDTRGFQVLSLVYIFVGAAIIYFPKISRRQNMKGMIWFWALFIILVLIIGIKVYFSQKATDLTGELPKIFFNSIFFDSIVNSSVQHSYAWSGLGWVFLCIVLTDMRFWLKYENSTKDKLRLLFSTSYILIFLFLSMILGSNGFIIRVRYGVILEIMSIPVLGIFLSDLAAQIKSRVTSTTFRYIAFTLLLICFVNFSGLSLIYKYEGGPGFEITGTNHFRGKEAYDYLTTKLKSGDVVMMDRFYFNNEMFGYQWPQIDWIRAKDYFKDSSKSIGVQMPDKSEGWIVLYPEAMVTTFDFQLKTFISGDFRYKYHGKFGDTYIWFWTKNN